MSPGELRARWGLTPHAALHLAELLRAFPGTRVTSGRRSAWRNRLVRGVRNSWHLYGRAADVVPPGKDWSSFVATARAQRVSPSCTGPEEVLHEGDHVHLAW